MSKKINRPVMHRISRMEEYGIGSARPSFQGHVKLGFREDGKLLAADLYIVQENGPPSGLSGRLAVCPRRVPQAGDQRLDRLGPGLCRARPGAGAAVRAGAPIPGSRRSRAEW